MGLDVVHGLLNRTHGRQIALAALGQQGGHGVVDAQRELQGVVLEVDDLLRDDREDSLLALRPTYTGKGFQNVTGTIQFHILGVVFVFASFADLLQFPPTGSLVP